MNDPRREIYRLQPREPLRNFAYSRGSNFILFVSLALFLLSALFALSMFTLQELASTTHTSDSVVLALLFLLYGTGAAASVITTVRVADLATMRTWLSRHGSGT